MNIETFANKLGVNRTYIVRLDPDLGAKDANDCLRKDPELIKKAIVAAKPIPSKNIVNKIIFFDNFRFDLIL